MNQVGHDDAALLPGLLLRRARRQHLNVTEHCHASRDMPHPRQNS